MPMPDVQADRTVALRQLIVTLFDFESLPGRYPLSLREPRILFDRSHDVLFLAAGRPVKGLAFDSIDMSRLKRAASFFIRTAMLRPGSDHYAVLGLDHGFSENSLRLHYRILIRLTHPDFVGNGGAWPTGSATRINLAHDVLSSAIRQAEYNRTVPGGEKRRILPVHSLAAVLPRPVAHGNTLFKYRAGAFVSAGFLALLLLGTLWPANPDDTHQRRVAQIELPNTPGSAAAESHNSARSAVQHQATSTPTVSASSSGSADQASKDLGARAVSASREAKEAEIAKLAQAEKLAQLARQSKVAKLAQSVKAEQDARLVGVVQAAILKKLQSADEATLARAKLTAIASQKLSEARTATLLVQTAKTVQQVQPSKLVSEERTAKLAETALIQQASKTAQTSLEFKAIKSVQLAPLIQETQLALAARLTNNAEVSATEVASMTGNAVPVKLLPIQPVSDTAAKPNLVDAQPALNQLIQSMQVGRGEDLLRGLERSVSRSSGASDLVNAYNLLIGGSRSVRVGRVQLRGRPTGDQLTVDGMVQLILQDQGQPLPVRELQLRAAFVMRDGQAVMTELSTSGSRP